MSKKLLKVLNDSKVSFDAKGLYSTIDYYYNLGVTSMLKKDLLNTCSDSERVFDSALDELVEHGYVLVNNNYIEIIGGKNE